MVLVDEDLLADMAAGLMAPSERRKTAANLGLAHLLMTA